MSITTSSTAHACRYIAVAALAVAAAIETVVVANPLAPAVIAFVLAAFFVDTVAAIDRATVRHAQTLRAANAWALDATHLAPSAGADLNDLLRDDLLVCLDEADHTEGIAVHRPYAHAVA